MTPEERFERIESITEQNSRSIGELQDLLHRTVRVLDEMGRRTDDRINALIVMFERYLDNRN